MQPRGQHLSMSPDCRAHPDARPDTELASLGFPEQFLVWSVRAWVDGHKSGTGRAGLLREGFALAGAADGWLLVEELMAQALERAGIRLPAAEPTRTPRSRPRARPLGDAQTKRIFTIS